MAAAFFVREHVIKLNRNARDHALPLGAFGWGAVSFLGLLLRLSVRPGRFLLGLGHHLILLRRARVVADQFALELGETTD